MFGKGRSRKLMIPVYNWPEPEATERIKSRSFEEKKLWTQVEKIVKNIELSGDQALLQYTADFDGCKLDKEELRVAEEEIEAAYQQVGYDFLQAIRQAKDNIVSFHAKQKKNDWFTQDEKGSIVGQIYRPLQRVGVYVPGGTARYPSSVLMTSLPALVAGVKEIVMVTPPGKEGKLPPATLVAAHEAGVKEIYRVGGAQAVAALAYGTETIRAVDKIVGPGNIYVTLAKKMVFGKVGIDMLAGPSEILLIGDGSVDPHYAAADLLSQAEHDKRARALLVTTSASYAKDVVLALEKQLAQLSRREIAQTALTDYGAVIIVKDLEEAFTVANLCAPEHLELLVAQPWAELAKVQHAGAVFLGPYSPEPLGDYWAGPNHVLPTSGSARYSSPLTVDDFVKRSSIINYTKQGLIEGANGIQILAETEGLTAHKASVAVRVKGVNS